MRIVLFLSLIASSLFVVSCANPVKYPTKIPVVLISIDGFANDYLTIYPTKNLHKIINSGLKAKALLPIFPSKTFPNHLSIITGVYPQKHGIIHNEFYSRSLDKTYHLGAGKEEPRWLSSPPLWTIAEQHNIKSAVYFWPESEAKVQGILPTYYFSYNKQTPNIDRVNQIIDWLKLPSDKKPQFIAGYFSIVDTAGHRYGRNSPELAQAIREIDDLIGVLLAKLKSELNNQVNLIIVSDHGMVQLNENSNIKWQQIIDNVKDVRVVNGQTQLLIYSKNKQVLAKLEQQFKKNSANKYIVYNSDNFPKNWHWQKGHASIPDLVLDANVPFIFQSSKYKNLIKDHFTRATHGYNRIKSSNLNAIFIAKGVNFKKHSTMPAFENISIAPLILHLLDLDNANNNMDGNYQIFMPYLKTHE
ncbi:MAG: hypothetical protein COB35_07500 [Gammaproteobacteria bacterium]|nr:MAG: hypothetical protein COB35_07500 [Gammaproteobacteria bacterium]